MGGEPLTTVEEALARLDAFESAELEHQQQHDGHALANEHAHEHEHEYGEDPFRCLSRALMRSKSGDHSADDDDDNDADGATFTAPAPWAHRSLCAIAYSEHVPSTASSLGGAVHQQHINDQFVSRVLTPSLASSSRVRLGAHQRTIHSATAGSMFDAGSTRATCARPSLLRVALWFALLPRAHRSLAHLHQLYDNALVVRQSSDRADDGQRLAERQCLLRTPLAPSPIVSRTMRDMLTGRIEHIVDSASVEARFGIWYWHSLCGRTVFAAVTGATNGGGSHQLPPLPPSRRLARSSQVSAGLSTLSSQLGLGAPSLASSSSPAPFYISTSRASELFPFDASYARQRARATNGRLFTFALGLPYRIVPTRLLPPATTGSTSSDRLADATGGGDDENADTDAHASASASATDDWRPPSLTSLLRERPGIAALSGATSSPAAKTLLAQAHLSPEEEGVLLANMRRRYHVTARRSHDLVSAIQDALDDDSDDEDRDARSDNIGIISGAAGDDAGADAGTKTADEDPAAAASAARSTAAEETPSSLTLVDENGMPLPPWYAELNSMTRVSASASASASAPTAAPAASPLDREQQELQLLDALAPSYMRARIGSTATTATTTTTPTTTTWAMLDRSDMSNFHQLVPQLAIQYPFELDTFQKQAVVHLERGDSVFVAAHTSAGKTVVAEYAVALAQRHLTKVVYTAPIKTLSNQKFRDFRTRFGEKDVGVITGDVSINPDASCLIMTTEVLRSMLYRGSDLIRELSYVIFDEVHYVNDAERGVVWEEVLIALPSRIQIIMLSATVPNTLQFASWVGLLKRRTVYVVATDRRPVPLQHYLWTKGRLFNFIDSTGRFLTTAFKQAREHSTTDKRRALEQRGYVRRSSARQSWTSLVQYLRQQALLPVVVFAFSKRMCEQCADSLANVDLTSSAEKSQIVVFCKQSLDRLMPADRALPQIMYTLEMCRRGVAVHHAGMLPILKEMVEMIFSRGLIKVLFATETFAMGVNMPTRSVVFSSLRKHDGVSHRELLPGEYTQMSGRAGRRGLDTFGMVIVMCADDTVPDEATIKAIATGRPSRLESRFRLTYSLILNVLRHEDLRVEDVLRHSFAEADSLKSEPRLMRCLQRRRRQLAAAEHALSMASDVDAQMAATKAATAATVAADEHAASATPAEAACSCSSTRLGAFRDLYVECLAMQQSAIHLVATVPALAPHVFAPGRVLLVSRFGMSYVLATVLRASSLASELETNSTNRPTFTCLLLLPDPGPLRALQRAAAAAESRKQQSSRTGASSLPSSAAASAGEPTPSVSALGRCGLIAYAIAEIRVCDVLQVYTTTLKVDAFSILGDKREQKIRSALNDLHALRDRIATGGAPRSSSNTSSSSGGGTALSTPDKPALTLFHVQSSAVLDLFGELRTFDLDSNALEVVTSGTGYKQMWQALLGSPVCTCAHARAHLTAIDRFTRSQRAVQSLEQAMRLEHSTLLPNLHQRIEVLRALNYIDDERKPTIKGRAACELSVCDAILGTEILLNRVLNDLSPEEIAALLSCLVFQDKIDEAPELSERLTKGLTEVIELCQAIANVSVKLGLDVIPAEFVRRSVNPGLMEVVYSWSLGVPFAQVCRLTTVLEGNITRCISRLHEACNQFRFAARVFGDAILSDKIERAANSLKRDIVFAASLYVQ